MTCIYVGVFIIEPIVTNNISKFFDGIYFILKCKIFTYQLSHVGFCEALVNMYIAYRFK